MAIAIYWQQWGMQTVLPIAQREPWGVPLIYAMALTGALGFAARSLAGAGHDVQRFKKLALE
jgi:hypothetical protein